MKLLDKLHKMRADGLKHGEDVIYLDEIEAWALAKQLHEGQVRWYTGEPYFKHVERVASYVANSPEFQAMDDEGKRVAYVSAILHDAVEDTELTANDVMDFCGPEVAVTVQMLTHEPGAPYDEYVERLLDHPIARIIKRADTCDNMATLPFDEARLWKKYLANIEQFKEVNER